MAESDLIELFVQRNAAYYTRAFATIQANSKPVPSFNLAAMVWGPIWAGMRGLSLLFLLLIFLDLLALTGIFVGIWVNPGASGMARVQQLEATVAERRIEAEKALASGDPQTAATATKLADNLEKAAVAARNEAVDISKGAATRVWIAVAFFFVIRISAGLTANFLYERRFSAWRGNRRLPSGSPAGRLVATIVLVLLIYGITIYSDVATSRPAWLQVFPADRALFTTVEKWFDAGFIAAYEGGRGAFDGVRDGIRLLVNGFEAVLVTTAWPVVMLVICTLSYQLAGLRVALFTAAALSYLALFGFWELSMQTVSLLGAASILCVVFGVPIGILLSRSKSAHAIAQPVLDFMQTMPAFVYLIPVIAFFGTGTPPGIIATLIFGMPPVIRLTTLGLNGVPDDVKEAARAYGATEWQILTGVELPLAKPSILAGINQTILMCLSMVVIASLIGAQGLGSVVLQSLQYAAKGQGLLAGLAILLCAMVIDRIVQGSFRRR